MSLFDRFTTYTIKPQSRQKSPGFGLCFKSRLTDIHETSGKMWAKFRARLSRILLSCGTCVKLGLWRVSPWASHSNNPKFQSKSKGWRETNKPHNNDKTGKDDLPENGVAIIFQTHFILVPLDLPTKLVLPLAIQLHSAMPNQGFLLFFLKRFYSFIWEKETDRGRARGRAEEDGQADSTQAQCKARSYNLEIMTLAKIKS